MGCANSKEIEAGTSVNHGLGRTKKLPDGVVGVKLEGWGKEKFLTNFGSEVESFMREHGCMDEFLQLLEKVDKDLESTSVVVVELEYKDILKPKGVGLHYCRKLEGTQYSSTYHKWFEFFDLQQLPEYVPKEIYYGNTSLGRTVNAGWSHKTLPDGIAGEQLQVVLTKEIVKNTPALVEKLVEQHHCHDLYMEFVTEIQASKKKFIVNYYDADKVSEIESTYNARFREKGLRVFLCKVMSDIWVEYVDIEAHPDYVPKEYHAHEQKQNGADKGSQQL